jgi:hypothetical protein
MECPIFPRRDSRSTRTDPNRAGQLRAGAGKRVRHKWLRVPDLNQLQSLPIENVPFRRSRARLAPRTSRAPGDLGPRRPENVGSRLLSLLQSAPDQTLSAIFGTAKKPNCRTHLRVRLGGSRAERYGKSLSECRFLSEAWGLADLLYKLFCEQIQPVGLVLPAESRYPDPSLSGTVGFSLDFSNTSGLGRRTRPLSGILTV